MKRSFRFISSNHVNIRHNHAFQFARRHALKIYNSESIYTFIPKNACSSMRLSVALANGFLSDIKDFNWIHSNNDTISSDLESLSTADYTFVILRCPYRRLASAFLDKIVRHTNDNWNFHELTDRKYDLSDLSFERFVKEIKSRKLLFTNIHWRPQTSFLIYEEYDDYFCLEDFKTLENTLEKKIDFKITDTRKLTNHGIYELELIENIQNPHLLSNFELLDLKRKGKSPHPRSLYTDELVSIVQDLYKSDLNYYQKIFGAENLLIK